ncbi:PBP1A family penicillin-binding protein [Caldichromatium japonicum]|uniref:Penicillin-binding protein 1A n=1 Tax=Caldichromatium japonicum TaxID=2699430 RepID=A0A6G7VE13_9GAMM|nr:PBP1A family penicillin-binding protein [Caldichromatium japonicum]QIK38150.1 PBP1A family penicillin-binding protein [Caldichromatium japonicum]
MSFPERSEGQLPKGDFWRSSRTIRRSQGSSPWHSASRWFFYLIGSALGPPLQLLGLGLVGVSILAATLLADLPDVQDLRSLELKQPLRVYSLDGLLIGEFGIERRQPVALRQVPPRVIQAFLAAEDSRFFEHRGIDTQGLVRALRELVLTGEKTQGGSTISMQLTRNLWLTPEKTFRRKLAELILTLHVEETLSKEEILELYLNRIFFGHRVYGISAAAALYYGKTLEQLTLDETAMLAAIPKAPSTINPIVNPARALERRDYVLRRMLELGYIDQGQYAQAIVAPNTASAHWPQLELEAGHIAEMVRAEIARFYGEQALGRGYRVWTTIDSRLQQAAQGALRSALHRYDERHGYRGPEDRFNIAGVAAGQLDAYLDEVVAIPGLTPGLITRVSANSVEVYLGRGQRVNLAQRSIDWARNQRHTERWQGPKRRSADALAVGDLVRFKQGPKGEWVLAPLPAVEGALIALDPRDGAIRALAGGYAFGDSKFNRAVEMRRQPGSSFKPFVYAAALDRGYTPASLVRDEALSYKGYKGWSPQNADGKELGPISLRRALALSRNLASINLLQAVGLETARAYVRRFGFDERALPPGLSLVLGTGELSPVKLAEGYAVFANGGFHVIPYFIERIEDSAGQVIFQARPARACNDCWYRTSEAASTRPLQPFRPAEQVIDPRIAYQMTSLLREVVERGTGTGAKRLNRPDIVGKTGTTNDIRDSWFAGYQAELVAVAWMGFDDFGKLGRGEEGGKAALGMWVDFMEQALKDRPIATLEPPPGLIQVQVGGGHREPRRVEWIQEEFSDLPLNP